MSNDDYRPTPEELAEQGRKVNLGVELALRWLSSLNTANHAGAAAARIETMRGGVGSYVTEAMAFLAMDVGRQHFGVEGFKAWLDPQLESAVDVNRHLDGSGGEAAGGPVPST